MNAINIQLRQVSTSTSEATMRTHHVLIDRPVEKDGADMGPMGGELFLAAVGGCFMSNLLAAARARQVAIADVRTTVSGTIADSPGRFSAVELAVTAGNIDQELLDRLVEIADRGCIMMNTLRGKLPVIRRVVAACPSPPILSLGIRKFRLVTRDRPGRRARWVLASSLSARRAIRRRSEWHASSLRCHRCQNLSRRLFTSYRSSTSPATSLTGKILPSSISTTPNGSM